MILVEEINFNILSVSNNNKNISLMYSNLLKGMGNTTGNMIRRSLMDFSEGYAPERYKVEGVAQYGSIEGFKEDEKMLSSNVSSIIVKNISDYITEFTLYFDSKHNTHSTTYDDKLVANDLKIDTTKQIKELDEFIKKTQQSSGIKPDDWTKELIKQKFPEDLYKYIVISKNNNGNVYLKVNYPLFYSTNIDIVNKDLVLLNSASNKINNINITIYFKKGIQYTTPFLQEKSEDSWLPLNSKYSPIVTANFRVIDGKDSSVENLIIECETNGAVEPITAIKKSYDLLINQLFIMGTPCASVEMMSSNVSAYNNLQLQDEESNTYEYIDNASEENNKSVVSVSSNGEESILNENIETDNSGIKLSGDLTDDSTKYLKSGKTLESIKDKISPSMFDILKRLGINKSEDLLMDISTIDNEQTLDELKSKLYRYKKTDEEINELINIFKSEGFTDDNITKIE